MTKLKTEAMGLAVRLSDRQGRTLAGAMAALAIVAAPGLAEATVFKLTGSDVVIDEPAPLFTSATVSGTLTLDDAILPGESFGASSVTGLTLDFGGITGTLGDIQADIDPGPVQVFGTRSADGATFSVFDLRFGFPSSVSGCGFVCAGQIVINSPIGPSDPSNFIAIDDFGGDTLSVISSFTPRFSVLAAGVPEPSAWAILLVGFGGLGVAMRSRRRVAGGPPPTIYQ